MIFTQKQPPDLSFFNSPDVQSFKTLFLSIILEAFPFILLGVLVSAVLQIFVSEQTIRRLVPKNPVLGILFACSVGLIFPLCECGMIPVIRRLMLKGMPVHVAAVLILAGPIINPVVYVSTFMAFPSRPEIAYSRMGLAFLVSLIIGLIVYRFVKINPLREARSSSHTYTFHAHAIGSHSHIHHTAPHWHDERQPFEQASYLDEKLHGRTHVNEQGHHHRVLNTREHRSHEHRGHDHHGHYQRGHDRSSHDHHGHDHHERDHHGHDHSSRSGLAGRLSGVLSHASDEFFDMGKYLMLGALITAVIQTLISREDLVSIAQGEVASHLFMMAFAFILSLCSTSDAFVAASFGTTFAAGSLLTFLVFGPMLDIKSVLMMLSAFRTRLVITLCVLIAVVVFTCSLLFEQLSFV
ncbi:permease [Paenibacillus xerothermodurans]|nr:permease [Paenibacillus xerothermodurans]